MVPSSGESLMRLRYWIWTAFLHLFDAFFRRCEVLVISLSRGFIFFLLLVEVYFVIVLAI